MKNSSHDFYDNEAAIYDEKRYTSTVGRLVNLIQKNIIKELSEINPGEIILDIGTGTGRFAFELAKERGKIIGLDPSKAMIQVFQKKINKENYQEQIELVIADANLLPFRERSIEHCISINVLNHVANYDSVLNEINRVLQNQSKFIANYPIIQSVYFPIGVYVNLSRKDIKQRVYSRWFSLSKIRISYANSGFAIDTKMGYFSPAFPFSNIFSRFVSYLIIKINKLVRKSVLKYASGVLFVRATKVG